MRPFSRSCPTTRSCGTARLSRLTAAAFLPLFENVCIQHFNLLWRVSLNGFDVAEFHCRCDGRANALMLIRYAKQIVLTSVNRLDLTLILDTDVLSTFAIVSCDAHSGHRTNSVL
jgi:hypothetical protein